MFNIIKYYNTSIIVFLIFTILILLNLFFLAAVIDTLIQLLGKWCGTIFTDRSGIASETWCYKSLYDKGFYPFCSVGFEVSNGVGKRYGRYFHRNSPLYFPRQVRISAFLSGVISDVKQPSAISFLTVSRATSLVVFDLFPSDW